MASHTIEILVIGKDKASGALKGVGGALSSLGKVAATGGLAVVGAAGAIGTGLMKLASDAAPLQGIENAFKGIAESSGQSMSETLAALEKGSLGMVSQRDLMATYNEAAQLVGTTFANQLPDAMQYLGKVSAATGQDMGYMLDSLTKGVGRLSPMILDNLGIQVDLTEANEAYAASIGKSVEELDKGEQQTALMNQVIEKLAANTASMPDITDNASTKMAQFSANIQNAKDRIGKAMLPVLAKFGESFANLAEKYTPLLIEALEQKVFPFLENKLGPLLGRVAEWLSVFIPQAIRFASNAWSNVLYPALSAVWSFIQNNVVPIFQRVVGWFQNDLPSATDSASGVFQRVIEAFGSAFTAIQDALRPIIEVVMAILTEIGTLFQSLMGTIISWVQANWPLIKEAVSDTMGTIKTIVSTILQAISDFWTAHGEKIMGFINNLWNVIKFIINQALNLILGIIRAILLVISGNWEEAWQMIKDTVANVWNAMVDWVTNTAGPWLWDVITGIVEAIPKIVEGIGSALYNAGVAIINQLWEGLKGKLEEVKAWFEDRLNDLRDMLPFSEPKDPRSPFRGLGKAGESIAGNILDGLRVGMPRLEAAMAGMSTPADGQMTRSATYNYGRDTYNHIVANDKGAMELFVEEQRRRERQRLAGLM